MKIENVTGFFTNLGSGLTYRLTSEVNNRSITCNIATDNSNCKLSYIHSAGNLILFPKKEIKEAIDKLLLYCKGYVILNTTNKTITDLINENYPIYYYINVPVGYGKGYQYNICFKNTVMRNSACREPEKIRSQSATKKPSSTKNIETKLRDILKKKRRKDDFVEEFINSL